MIRKWLFALAWCWCSMQPVVAAEVDDDVIRVQLKWLHQFQFAGFYMALEKGFYQDAGLKVRLLEGGPGKRPIETLLAGRADYAVGDSGLLLYRASGRPVVALACLFQHSPQVIYTREDIESPADLRGRRVMMQDGYLTVEVLALLWAYGLDQGDFVRQPIGTIDDLIEGRTDAFPGYSSNEAFALRQQGFPFRMFVPRDAGIDFYGDVLATTEREIHEHPERAALFRAATLKGWSYALEHPEETVDVILKRYNTQHKSREHLLFEAHAIHRLMEPEVIPVGLSNEERWKLIARTFVASGLPQAGSVAWDRFLYHPSIDWLSILREYRALIIVVLVFGMALLLGIYSLLLRYRVRQRTRQLQEASEEFERILNRMQDVYYRADAEGRLQWISASVQEKLGYSREELIHQPLAKLYVDPDGRKKFLQALAANGGRLDDYRIELKHKDGRCVWAEVSSQFIHDRKGRVIGVEGNVRDISRRVLAEDMARRARAELEVIFDNMLDTFYRADNEGKVVFASPSVRQLLGVEPGEILGTRLDEWYADPDGREQFLQALRHNHGAITNYETRLRRRDGSVVWVSASSHYVYDDDGSIIGVEGMVRDITERKRAEEEKWLLMNQFQQAQKMESVALLAGGIAHDFNNLLVGVLGSAELALMDIADRQRLREHLQQIVQSAQLGSELVRQLLAYAGHGRIQVERLDGNRLIREMSNLLRTVVGDRAHLELALKDRPCWMEADASQVRQVVLNLVGNAAEAVSGPSACIWLRCERVRLSDEQAGSMMPYDAPGGDYVMLEVKDNGSGIEPEMLDRVFDPFFTTKDNGTGLGLSAVMGIVRQNGGCVHVASQPGKGSCFRVYFPALTRWSPKEDGPRRQGLVPALTRQPFKGQGCILIVDDEAPVRRVASAMLSRAGFDALTAEDGAQALDMLGRRHDIDLVLLDLSMPRMDGAQLFSEIRKLRPDVPVLVSSGYAQGSVTVPIGPSHKTGFLRKPYVQAELIEAVSGLMQAS